MAHWGAVLRGREAWFVAVAGERVRRAAAARSAGLPVGPPNAFLADAERWVLQESGLRVSPAEPDAARENPVQLSDPRAPAPAALRASEVSLPPETAAVAHAALLEQGWPEW